MSFLSKRVYFFFPQDFFPSLLILGRRNGGDMQPVNHIFLWYKSTNINPLLFPHFPHCILLMDASIFWSYSTFFSFQGRAILKGTSSCGWVWNQIFRNSKWCLLIVVASWIGDAKYWKQIVMQSAKTNLNVEEVFFSIARDIKQRLVDTDSKAEVIHMAGLILNKNYITEAHIIKNHAYPVIWLWIFVSL